MEIELEEGKYRVVQKEDGSLCAYRHGQSWRDLTGDKLVLACAQRIVALEEIITREQVARTEVGEGSHI